MAMKKLIAAGLLCLSLAGCVQPEMPTAAKEDQRVLFGEVTKFIDEQYGVVCWVLKGYKKGGISCIPLSQTKRGE